MITLTDENKEAIEWLIERGCTGIEFSGQFGMERLTFAVPPPEPQPEHDTTAEPEQPQLEAFDGIMPPDLSLPHVQLDRGE